MIRKRVAFVLWLLAAGCLYFFENNTGTRIVLAASVLLPLLVRFLPDRSARVSPPAAVPGPRAESLPEEAPAGHPAPGRALNDPDVTLREYRPGDSLRRVHWKLSAKVDRLLVRESLPDPEVLSLPRRADTDDRPAAESGPRPGQIPETAEPRRRSWLAPLLLLLLALALLLAVPAAREGLQVLLNRLFDRSEALNRYLYTRFPVDPGRDPAPALVLLALAAAAWIGLLLTVRSPLLPVATACLLAGVQVWFGLSLPPWLNVLLFSALGLPLLPGFTPRSLLLRVLTVLALCAVIALLFPGVDAATEELSERVRDLLTPPAAGTAQPAPELPEEYTETRHTNPRDLLPGSGEAGADSRYRLLSREEEQISRPHWVDVLRIVLLLLLAVAVIVLPFLPFAMLNLRRRKAREARAVFGSGDVAEASQAMFRRVIAWLTLTGHGGGNRLYRSWDAVLAGVLPPEYVRNFAECAAIFEEAVYSAHPLPEDRRTRMRSLLDETEKILYDQADRKLRFRLKYVECLCE